MWTRGFPVELIFRRVRVELLVGCMNLVIVVFADSCRFGEDGDAY